MHHYESYLGIGLMGLQYFEQLGQVAVVFPFVIVGGFGAHGLYQNQVPLVVGEHLAEEASVAGLALALLHGR